MEHGYEAIRVKDYHIAEWDTLGDVAISSFCSFAISPSDNVDPWRDNIINLNKITSEDNEIQIFRDNLDIGHG
ncbi:hypothetical protein GWI33_011968 [Rhynchophorus ferrugineus]|uniref:Uncharacterized protein n=1 Tax=Rhynchophorus ferrugineus TaxID=354439 RepID=A0A834J1G3_RHYFE|nr:hypothetical protein GWI33_011968 [Rhynchophorus ferrugineus]